MSKLKVKKRDGREVDFEWEKIRSAIERAIEASEEDCNPATIIEDVEHKIEEMDKKEIHVEEIQDIVEETLMDNGCRDTARKYILYREKRQRQRQLRERLGVVDDLKLGIASSTVLNERYLLREDGEVVETPAGLFRRVAHEVAKVDKKYDKNADVKTVEELFYNMMTNLDFLPNSPTLYNAGTKLGLLSACFVLPVEDDLQQIFESVAKMAVIQKAGGGTGFSFSRIRPRGDIVGGTAGESSGPLSFMRVFNEATATISQGGRRRGANMAVLRVDHPDIIDFIVAKSDLKEFTNFNFSVGITDEFMEAYKKNKDYNLINPRTKKTIGSLSARLVMDQIALSAWRTGDPGVVFLDRINDLHPLRGEIIEATNPCGEQPLLPWESCNLGSINLSNMVKDQKIDYDKLKRTVKLAVHFLDNVIDANKYPFDEIAIKTKATRKIGLGVMGWAEMLALMGIRYDSDNALELAEELSKFIYEIARKASAELAKVRGNFEAIGQLKSRKKWLRNATVFTIAPTGSISIIANTSSGIEPFFGVSYIRVMAEGIELKESVKAFKHWMGDKLTPEIEMQIAKNRGSVQNINGVIGGIKKLFKKNTEIDPKWHVKMQAAWQKHVDNAVSKTCNLPVNATPEDIKEIYVSAYDTGCKGITVYRKGSREGETIFKDEEVEDDEILKCELVDPNCPRCDM